MRFSFAVIAMILMLVAAACSGGSGEERLLPTSMALPTLEEQAPQVNVETEEAVPTIEPTEAPVLPEPTAEPVEVVPEETEVVAESLPFVEPQTVEDTSNSLPPIARQGEASTDEWTVISDQPISAFACADTTCDIVTTFQPGETVEVSSTNEEWVTARFEEQDVFVSISLLEPLGPLTVGNQIPPAIAGEGTVASSPFDDPNGSSLPPFVQNTNSGTTSSGGLPPFASNSNPPPFGQSASPDTSTNPNAIVIPPADG